VKLKWFEINNFRSIVNSGRCFVGNEITVLAGKNESGKSNLLKALESFSKNSFDSTDFPMGSGEQKYPTVTVCFLISKNELLNLFNLQDQDLVEEYDLIVTRHANENEGEVLSGSASECLFEKFEEEKKKFNQDVIQIQKDLVVAYELPLELINQEDQSSDLSHNISTFRTEVLNSTSNGNVNPQYNEFFQEKLRILNEISTAYDQFLMNINNTKQILFKAIPEFILFNSFDDILPSEVSIDEAKNSKIVTRFFKFANKNPEDILVNAKKSQQRKALVKDITTMISGNFGTFYKQDDVRVELDVDGPKLQFYIYDKDGKLPFSPDQRSKGFQWFLSFYITLSAESTSESAIILIDEPGLYLHPKAQEDMLEILENLAIQNQVVFTTHSPYLIDPDRIDRVRLVLKNIETGTYVENKPHRGADKETLTPIITAIGFDLSQGIGISPNCNIITEGISDYYYVKAMTSHLQETQFSIIPSVGAQKIPLIASILLGWCIPSIVLLDNDKEGRQVEKTLRNDLQFDKEIVFASLKKDEQIEDLFSKEDFHQYVLYESSSKISVDENSQVAKTRDKVMIAKNFMGLITKQDTEFNFSKETIDNFKDLFSRLAIARDTIPLEKADKAAR
jgi:predicted ATP-dependent endonuclease of OLD family